MLSLTAAGYVTGTPKFEQGDRGDSVQLGIRCRCSGGKHTSFVNARFYGKRAKVIEEYIKDGDHIVLSGTISLILEKERKDGTKYSAVYINGADFTLPIRPDSEKAPASVRPLARQPVHDAIDEEIPF